MPQLSVPKTLPAFPSEQANTWVLSFVPLFTCSVLDPSILEYDLSVDTVQTFSSPNLRSYTKTSAGLVEFQEGQVAKAFVINLPPRTKEQAQSWYWRIRINSSKYVSDWCSPQPITVLSNESLRIASDVHSVLADSNTYSKESGSTNLFQLFHLLAQEKDLYDFEQALSKNDLSLGLVRDSRIADVFGDLVSHAHGSATAPDYRNQVVSLLDAFLNRAGVVQGISDAVVPFLVEPPTVFDVGSTPGWIMGSYYLVDPAHTSLDPIATLYSDLSVGFGWRLIVYNSWDRTYDQATLEKWIFRMVPTHTKVTISYATTKNTCALFNHTIDWNQGTFSNTAAVGNSLRLSGTVPAPTVGTIGSNQASGFSTSSVTFAHTCSGIDRLLVVFISDCTVGGTVASVTYAGVALTLGVSTTDANGQLHTFLYYLVAPSTGANNVVVTLDVVANIQFRAQATSYNGVNQTAPIGGTGSSSASGSSASISVSSQAGSLIVDGFSSADTPSVTGGQTPLSSGNYAGIFGSVCANSYVASTAGTTVVGWSMPSTEQLAYVAMEILPSPTLSGTWTSPVMDTTSSVSTWGALETNQTLSGQQVSVLVRTSSDGVGFSGYEDITNTKIPSTTGQQYFQQQIRFQSVSYPTYTPIVNSTKLPYRRF